MRVLIVNTSEKTGGAAVAANRLMEALNNHGVKAKMLVRDKETDALTVVGLRQSPMLRWNFLWERWCIFWHLRFSRKHLFEIDIANAGTDITRLREFREADVIHLHWINQGMLSLGVIKKILNSGKPVVWTMHDMWPATGICHLTLGCGRYISGCQNCRLLPGGGSAHDLSSKVWKRKQQMLFRKNISFVACSHWLQTEASRSALLKEQKVRAIPNPIDTRLFCKKDKQEARRRLGLPLDLHFILFVSQRVTNVNKGMDYLQQACQLMAERNPERAERTGVLVLGGHAEDVTQNLPFKAWPLGYVNDMHHIVDVYNAADVFVLPSLSENLPNTIMEAMACGVPCVGFNIGGIPEEIDHMKTGYVARYKDAEDLATGIDWVLNDCDYAQVSSSAISKVAHHYSQQIVAMKYIELYNEALAIKHYKL